jgi:hypothetical protein
MRIALSGAIKAPEKQALIARNAMFEIQARLEEAGTIRFSLI